MDPNAARSKMIEKANTVIALTGAAEDEQVETFLVASVQLAEAVHDLDGWLRSGGFMPDVWLRGPMRHQENLQAAQQGRKQDVDVSVPEAKPSWEDTTTQVNRTGGPCSKTVATMDETGRAYRPCMLDLGHYGECVPQDA